MKRRHFLSSSLATAGLFATRGHLHAEPPVPPPVRLPNRIRVSSYSFWAFTRDELRPLDTCLDHAARMGFDGLEILQRQLVDTDRATLQKIKRHAFLLGLDLMGYSTHQGFLSPDKVKRFTRTGQ